MARPIRELTNPWCFLSLRDQIQALAQPAAVQLSVYPDGSAKVDELALDFEHWWLCVKSNDGHRLTAGQVALLNDIDHALSEMSGAENHELWTETGLHERDEWEHVRQLARRTLDAFRWPYKVPANFEGAYSEEDLDVIANIGE